LKNKNLIKEGIIRGRSPQAKLRVSKAKGLKDKAGWLIKLLLFRQSNSKYKSILALKFSNL